MAETLPIPVASLLIDTQNPRLPELNLGQRDAQRVIAQEQQRKLLKLAEDIVAHGLDLAALPITMQLKGDELNRYVVFEGNRRLVALRGLENPEWMIGAVQAGVLTEMRALSRQYLQNPIESIICLVVKDRSEADHWIELRHTGENLGAGIVRWGTHETDRYRKRTSPPKIHTLALDFLEQMGVITPEQRRRVPASSLKRLLETDEVASKVGIQLRAGKLMLLAAEKRVAKALKYVVDDLTRPGPTKKRTKDIYHKPDRLKYADNLPANIAITPTKKSVPVTKGAPSKPKRLLSVRVAEPRDQLIGPDCVLNITEPRLRDIYHELRRLSLSTYTNAVSVLFRVWVELSCDAYVARQGLSTSIDAKLSTKLQDVASDLVKRKRLSDQQARPVRIAAERDKYLPASTTTMNEYIHNPYLCPAAGDLRAGWNSLQSFFIALWSV